MPVQLSRELLARFGREPTTLLALAGLGAQEPQAVDTTDGLRLTARSGEIVHLRPSGNAPELRCYSEADTPERARKLVEEVLRSEEHTSELQSLMRISYAVFCLKKKKNKVETRQTTRTSTARHEHSKYRAAN